MPEPLEEPFDDTYWGGPERPTGEIAVTVDGATHAVTYLDSCFIGGRSVDASGVSDLAEVYIPHHTGDGFAFAAGDPRHHRGNFGEADIYTRSTELEFQRDGNTVSWTGMLTAPDGSEVDATVTVRFDGEDFLSLGTAEVDLGGAKHLFEYPSVCDITGSLIEFQGREGQDTDGPPGPVSSNLARTWFPPRSRSSASDSGAASEAPRRLPGARRTAPNLARQSGHIRVHSHS